MARVIVTVEPDVPLFAVCFRFIHSFTCIRSYPFLRFFVSFVCLRTAELWRYGALGMEWCLRLTNTYQVRQKSNPQKLFAVFFFEILHVMWLSYLHFGAKWHLIIFKYDKVINISAWPLSEFRAVENVCAETAKQRHWNNTMFSF